jgi:hypothetical protein
MKLKLDEITRLPHLSCAQDLFDALTAEVILPQTIVEYGSAARVDLIIESLLRLRLPEKAIHYGLITEPDLSHQALKMHDFNQRTSPLIAANPLNKAFALHDDALIQYLSQKLKALHCGLKLDIDDRCLHLDRFSLDLKPFVQFDSERKLYFVQILFWDPQHQRIQEMVCDPVLDPNAMIPLNELRHVLHSPEAFLFEADLEHDFALNEEHLTELQRNRLNDVLEDDKLSDLTRDAQVQIYKKLLNDPPRQTTGDPSGWRLQYDPAQARRQIAALQCFHNHLLYYQSMRYVQHAILSKTISAQWLEHITKADGLQLMIKQSLSNLQLDAYAIESPRSAIKILKAMQSAGLLTYVDAAGNLHGLLVDAKQRHGLLNHKYTLKSFMAKAICLQSPHSNMPGLMASIELCRLLHELRQDPKTEDAALLKSAPILVTVFASTESAAVVSGVSSDVAQANESLRRLAAALSDAIPQPGLQFYPYRQHATLQLNQLPPAQLFNCKRRYQRCDAGRTMLVTQLAAIEQGDIYIHGEDAERAAYTLASHDKRELIHSVVNKSALLHKRPADFAVSILATSTVQLNQFEAFFIRLIEGQCKVDAVDASQVQIRYGDFQCYQDDEATIKHLNKAQAAPYVSLTLGVQGITLTERDKRELMQQCVVYRDKHLPGARLAECSTILQTTVLKLAYDIRSVSAETLKQIKTERIRLCEQLESDWDAVLTCKQDFSFEATDLSGHSDLALLSDLNAPSLVRGSLLALAVILKHTQQPSETLRRLVELHLPKSYHRQGEAFTFYDISLFAENALTREVSALS